MPAEAAVPEQDLRNWINEGGFAVALSGGGHRATLATLGALMAIIDRGLGPKIIQVASVSGGSITNAFVAQRAHLERLRPGELDDIASELATTIIRKGVLTRGWFALLLFVPILFGVGVCVGVCIALLRWILPWTSLGIVFGLVIGLVIGTVVAFTAFTARGLVVEWLLDRRYFRHGTSGERRSGRGRARLASLSGRRVDHVFCMTDLVLGLPVYASSQHGGIIYRRLKPERTGGGFPMQTFPAGEKSIAGLVRASAAFPGISPRLMLMPPDPDNDLVAESPRLAFLADGGDWNNLGTQVLREDGFSGNLAVSEEGVLRLRSTAPSDMPLLCFNGSGPLRPTCSWGFLIPGIALFKTLMQTTKILSTNTVLPRVDAMGRAFASRVWTSQAGRDRAGRPDHLDPADLIADLRATDHISDDYSPGTLLPEFIRLSDPEVIKWEREVLKRVREAHNPAATSRKTDLAYILGPKEPKGSSSACGLTNYKDWETLQNSSTWKLLVKSEGKCTVSAPTTLGRIEPALARRLIARGYLNTYLLSLFLAPLEKGEINRLAELPDRLDKIVGVSPVQTPVKGDHEKDELPNHAMNRMRG